MNECSWCKGKGTVRKALSLTRLTLLEWALVVGLVVIVVAFVAFFGKSHGTISLFLVLGICVGVPVLQLIFWIAGAFGLISRKVECSRCKGAVLGDKNDQ